jgi:predicted flavoprotein YhiN
MGWDEAIITQGGISLKDIDTNTMQSKKVKGLYIIGEVLDVDANTGGFNLQIAFSTAALASDNI